MAIIYTKHVQVRKRIGGFLQVLPAYIAIYQEGIFLKREIVFSGNGSDITPIPSGKPKELSENAAFARKIRDWALTTYKDSSKVETEAFRFESFKDRRDILRDVREWLGFFDFY